MGIEELPGTKMRRTDRDYKDVGNVANANQIDIVALFWACWIHKYYILAITLMFFSGALIYSFVPAATYTARVTMLPHRNLGPRVSRPNLASFISGSLSSGMGYEDLYSRILMSDRLLDPACSRRW